MDPTPVDPRLDERDRTPLSGPLGRRLLGWFLLFSLLPLLITNATGYLRSEAIIQRLVERDLAEMADVEAKHVAGEVDRQLLGLQTIAGGNAFLVGGAARILGNDGEMARAADSSAVAAYLTRKLTELPAYTSLFLAVPGRGGVLVPGGNEEVVRITGGTPARFSALEGRTAPDAPRYRVMAPITDASGETVAYLGGLIGTRGMGELLQIPPHLAGSIESFIVDSTGRPLFVSHAHEATDYLTPLGAPPLKGPADRLARYRDREGTPVIGYSAVVPGLGWRYLVEAPLSVSMGPLHQLRTLSLAFGTLFALLLGVSAWLVTGDIVAPVRRLVAATRRVGGGDLDARVPAAGSGEIDELGRAFNEMTAQLAAASERVEAMHQREISRAHQLATVGELASGVAHEIKNPLIGISNGLDLVQRRLGPDPTLAPIVDEMMRELQRIEIAVRDLLAFARPATPSLRPTDAGRIVERSARLVRPAAEQAGVSLETSPDPELPEVRLDEELMQQAIVNLTMNGIHATSPGGHVTVGAVAKNGEVLIYVRDTGKGIPPEMLDDIFKPFFTTRHSGTGLGLSITREIVERHGGRIEVRSRLGEGSEFGIHLPVAGPGNGTGEAQGRNTP